jgi:hypothetical protein
MPYRETEYGGYDRSFVLTPDGKIIRPVASERSNSGRHGWDIWQLGNGRYVIVSISRPNTRNGPKPYSVTVQCLDTGKVINERKFYVMDWSLEDVRNWATQICP